MNARAERARLQNPSGGRPLNRLAQVAVIAGVLGLSALLALAAVSERVNWAYLVAITLAAAGVVFMLRRSDASPIGLLLVLVTAGLVNIFTLPTGSDSRLVVSLILALGFTGIWLFNGLVLHKRVALLPSPLNASVIAWCAVSVFAYVWSLLMRDPLLFVPSSFVVVQLAALIVNLLLPLQILLVINTIGVLDYDEGVRWLRRMVAVVLIVAAVAIAGELLNLPIGSAYRNGTRGIFGMWAVTLALSLALFNRDMRTVFRVALIGLCAAWFYRDFVENSIWLSGWMPMVTAVVVVLFLRSKRLFALAVLVALAYVTFNAQELYMRIVIANIEEGSTSRLDIWAVALSYIVRHPLFGMGPAGYAVYYMTYDPLDARSTHNNYFDVVAQTGIVGMFIFLWMGASVLRLSWGLSRSLRGERNFEAALAAAVTAGCVGAATGMMLGDWVLPFAYNQTISGFDNAVFTWMLFGAAGALYALRAARKEGAA